MEEQTRLVYVCEGGDCSERGSMELHGELKSLLEQRDTHGKVKLRRYPCFGGCEHGINLVVYPDRVFYSECTSNDLPDIVNHVVDGGPTVTRLTGKVAEDVEQITYDLLTTGM